ncbi:hypothetical protein L2719_01000 [Shewanella schlegeliana]|uniref:Phage shock protein B n=1 Tax=Shewanella schlegeliana TaxID=190308 RepID=A0ABS1SV36_9GAMM|nr:hypothetical protein [Shewanella schlegeliana]MBL4912390.1 hypothetical protein [Shewanella schlegeliana]MCL1108140.1 hypothetical protein [Shewanella schlegeliana]GIU21954.1 hypothetical protein TUM4433_02000 [Shewanella schlegeliana]
MGPFTVAALAIIGVFSIAAFKEYNKHKGRVELNELVSVKTELEKLRERVATLEQIVTDKSYQLKDEIDKL